MKTVIILGSLFLSLSAFSQGRSEVVKAEKQIGQTQTEIKEKADKAQKEVKDKVSQGKEKAEEAKDKAKGKQEEAKEKLNNGNAYGKDKQGMTGREFGQNRAAEAKAKVKEIKTEEEAEEMIETSKKETKETMDSVQSKMESARGTLMDKLTSGEITQVQFDEKMKQLMDFEKRKNAIVEKMK